MVPDLRPKLAFVLLLSVCAFVLSWQVLTLLIALVLLLPFVLPTYHPASPRARRLFLRFVLFSVALSGAIITLNGWMIQSGEPVDTILGITLYSGGLLFGIQTASRLVLLSFSVLLFFTSTPIPVCINALQQSGLSRTVVLMLLLTLHFLDTLPERIDRIFVAQEARGAPVRAGFVSRTKAFFSILSPLLLSSMAESVDRGVALELRGFLLETAPSFHTLPPAKPPSPVTVLLLTASVLIVVFSLARWLFP
jgi:energy-coupling factor transport system permease protein